MSGRSSWCFTDDHPGCRYPACTCDCHRRAAEVTRTAEGPQELAGPAPNTDVATAPSTAPSTAVVLPEAARPVPGGTQVELGFPDSIDGSTDDVATVTFSLRGQVYEVDLSRRHRDELQAALAPFTGAARRA